MKGFAESGFRDFILALGYLGGHVKEHFLEADGWRGRDIRLRLGSHTRPQLLGARDDWTVLMIDTGLDTNTGGRLKRLEGYIKGDVFFATYGDGVANIDHCQLLDYHRSHGKIATMTVVRPRLTFGVVELDQDCRVLSFREKPPMEAWINGGFFVFDRRIFSYLDQDSVLERDPMERLAMDGQLVAFRHDGFWACMDTYKDNVDLNAIWAAGEAPWRSWES
jgi:glucose-1-phosphate cytidylyltransferase